ncbi:MAG: hypothetical protein WCF23_08760 [Candidatus Nitrosopolaris sp.]
MTGDTLSADLYIAVEIVTGEVVDLIYQIKPLEFFGLMTPGKMLGLLTPL